MRGYQQKQQRQASTNQSQQPAQRSVLRSPQALLMQMQQTMGNRAVSQLLRNRQNEAPIQRQMVDYVPGVYPVKAHSTLDKKEIEELDILTKEAEKTAKEIDGSVEKGRGLVQGVIDDVMSGDMEATDVAAEFSSFSRGHARDFQNRMVDWVAGQSTMNPAAAGGYIIEDYASEKSGGDVAVQTTPKNLRGSRPDFMIEMDLNGPGGRSYYGLLDVTANSSSSVGHILKKGDGSWVKRVEYPYVAESVYDPLDFGKGKRPLTKKEQEAAVERAKQKQADKEELKKISKLQFKRQFDQAVDLVKDDIKNKGKIYKQFHNASSYRLPRSYFSLKTLGISYDRDTGDLETIDFQAWFEDDSISVAEKKDAIKSILGTASNRYSPY